MYPTLEMDYILFLRSPEMPVSDVPQTLVLQTAALGDSRHDRCKT